VDTADSLIPIAFDTTQISSPVNYSSPQPGDPCHPLAAGAHAPAIAFHGSQDPDVSGDVTHPVGRNQGQETCVAYTTKLHNTASNNAGKVFKERSTCLDANSPPPALLTAMQVRRLTPVECERLQGFPDNYTAIPWRNKLTNECPDGPRYKALGNSWAVPVVAWIGKRIAEAA
jgi:DNA (cytosine-5)-methyltransferase 1